MDHFGSHGKIDIEVGTISKAFGVMSRVVGQQSHRRMAAPARAFLFSTAFTAPNAAVELPEESTTLIDKLLANANYFKLK